jgi:hypothetical protein
VEQVALRAVLAEAAEWHQSGLQVMAALWWRCLLNQLLIEGSALQVQ